MSEEFDPRVAEHIKGLLECIPGEKPDREGLADTPKRVAKAWREFFAGYEIDPALLLAKTFESDNQEMVVVKDIDYFSHCEHHMVPFHGRVHIGYVPNGRVLGLSKFARLVEVFARRLQIQEQMTYQIADAIEKHLKPSGVIVVVTGQHMCMSMRGVKKQNSWTVTSAVRGNFKNQPETRKEFYDIVGDITS